MTTQKELDIAISRAFRKYGKYAPVFLLLRAIPEDQKQMALTFAELSRILDNNLPASARRYPEWWSNNATERQAKAWVDAGWKVQEVFLKAETVVFRKAGSDPVREVPKYIRSLLNAKPMHKRPHCYDLADWIAFCRRVGWHFEGVTLYEQCGLALDGLSEGQRAEVEEDYAVCKRALGKVKNENRFYQVLSAEEENDADGGETSALSKGKRSHSRPSGIGRLGAKRDELADLVAAGIVPPGLRLKHVNRRTRERYNGTVTESGTVLVDNDEGHEEYPSLSAAAVALTGASINGWIWWTAEFDDGCEVLMDELRTQYRSAHPPAKSLPVKPRERPTRTPKASARRTQLADLVAAGLVAPGTRLRHVSERTGDEYSGAVTESGGVLIKLNGKSEEFPSLSAAAVALTGTSLNGWIWWTAELGGGREVIMDELRKELK